MSQGQITNRDLGWLSLGIVLWTLELCVLLGVVLSMVPVDVKGLLGDVFPRDISSIKPDWKIHIYHGALVCALAFSWIMAGKVKVMAAVHEHLPILKLMCAWSTACLSVMLFAVFAIVRYPALWGWVLLSTALVCSFASKILMPEIIRLWTKPWFKKLAMVMGVSLAMTAAASAPSSMKAALVMYLAAVFGIFALFQFGAGLRMPLERCAAGVLPGFVWIGRQPVLVKAGIWMSPVLIASLLGIVDPVAVLAKTAFGEHYYHFDFMLMAGAYVSSVGHVLGVDHNVFYGLGMPKLVAMIAKAIDHEVTYVSVFKVYWGLCILYFLALFFCFRAWLASSALGLAAVLLAIKWQVFYSLSYPVSAIYPNGSVLRCLWDIPIMLVMYAFITTGHWGYLVCSAIGIGLAIVYVPTTGVDLCVGLVALLGALAISKAQDRVRMIALAGPALGVVAVTALFGFWALCGNAVFHSQFWTDLKYYPSLFTNGFYNIWFWDNLTQGKVLNFAMSLAIPSLYLGTMVWIGFRLYFKKASNEEIITCVVCAYGLSLYHHYLTLSLANNFYMRAIACVWVIFYWVKWALSQPEIAKYRPVLCALLLFCSGFFLLSNRLYQAFPNLTNTLTVRNPMVDPRRAYGLPEDGRPYFFHQEAWVSQANKTALNSLGTTQERIFFEYQIPNHDVLKELYAQEFDFKKDAMLIASLTQPAEKVALLSSFEIHMLMQAKRGPLFFFFPVVSSRAMTSRTFPPTNLHTRTMMERTIKDLKDNRPQYVFLEKVMLQTTLPESYPKTHVALLGILDYVKAHYEPDQQGQYLVAMRRKD